MPVIPKQVSFIFSSATENGALNVSPDGSSFEVVLSAALQIPRSAVYCDLAVTQALIWNTSPNISTEFSNNIFEFTTSNAGNPGTHTITIPDGLYSLEALNGFIGSSTSNLGLPANLITITGDDATQKSVLTFLDAGDSVDFTVANSCREILGFDARIAPTAPQIAGWSEFSDEPANFNRVNSYLVTSNIVSNGIPINTGGRGVIAAVPISEKPGSQITYQPQNPIYVNASELIGGSKLNINLQLRDQLLRLTPTAGEDWSVVVVIKYGVLLSKDNVPLMKF